MAMSDAIGFAEMLDAVGYNYQESRYPTDHKNYPNRFIFGSENKHQYGNWAVVRDNDYAAGQFLWTGIDYLGEANGWPNKGSSAGLLDLCGFKKPNAWFRQSLWSDKPMVYISSGGRGTGGRRGRGSGTGENWNGTTGASVNVSCYTNCPEVLLVLNDKPIGNKTLSEATNGVLNWTVPYEPGVIKAIGRKDGTPVCEYVLQTAGPAKQIRLLPDMNSLFADGKDICHIEFRIVDDKGVRVPDAGNELTFEVSGPGAVIGIENGNISSTENYMDMVHRAYQGRGLAVLQSTTAPGSITLKVTSAGLEPAELTLVSR
jgi:beta-galactosidase